jgi:short-subunit dehydrogenase
MAELGQENQRKRMQQHFLNNALHALVLISSIRTCAHLSPAAELAAGACSLQVNFFAQWEMNNAVAPVMVQQRSGVIVNIGSVSGYCAVAQAAAYSASK